MTKTFVGDCRDEEIIESLFGSVSDFANIVEEKGDSFTDKNLVVEHDEKKDIHSFYLISKSYFCKDCGCPVVSCPHKIK